MPEPSFILYSKPEYFTDLIDKLARAKPGERVISTTMTFEPADPNVKLLIAAFTAAARRGVKVTLVLDPYSFLLKNTIPIVPLLLHAQLPETLGGLFRSDLQILEELVAAGGRYVIINEPSLPFTSPVMGRSHIKLTIIGSRIYLGGCNLEGYDRLDMMAGWDDSKTADWLSGLVEQTVAAGSVKAAMPDGDATLKVGPLSTLFVDAGVRGRSLILDEALAFIDNAREHILITCQFFPGHITAKHLLAAHKRGVKVRIIFNHPRKDDWPNNVLHYVVLEIERHRYPKSFFQGVLSHGPNYLHTKLIATEQGAMIGSHNFVQAGVSFGTAELALLVRDPDFARRATTTVLNQLPPNLILDA